jgi:hypothetical protein
MFKLFKSERQVIEEIHNEFDTAEDRLLSSADNLLKELNLKTTNEITNKVERLKAIGFTNTPTVKRQSEINQVMGTSQEQAELIRYYKQEYPFLKFLTEVELNKICKKYNLVYMPIENYIGEVPDKNIVDIENAKPRKDQDKPEDKKWCEIKKDNSFWLTGAGGSWCGIWGKEWYRIPKRINDKHFRSNWEVNEYLQEERGFKTRYLVSGIKNFTQDRQGLFICAPKSQFVGKDRSISLFEVKDPIVFRYCRGGIQVLSKWGLEASDELLINETLN